jgi:hypothetical protein
MRFVCCIPVAIITLFCSSAAVACSMAGCSNDGDEMRPTFTIQVTHADKPLAGVNFHIVAKGTEQFSGITDESGAVHVPKLAAGEYWLNGDLLGTGVVYTCFHVSAKPSRRAKIKLTYTWGDEALATNKIAGRLVASQPAKGGTPIWNLTHRVDVPIAQAGLTLRDPVSHAVYMTTSDQDGHFLFEGLPNGTYVLHIEGGSAGEFNYDPANSIVELTNIAKRTELLFKGGPSGCGDGSELALQLFD